MKTAVKVLGLFAGLLLALSCVNANAQAYPNKPIKFVVGYPPGGGTDIIARLIAQKVGERIGQPVVVENKPGANAIIGAEYVAKAVPDGYTLYVGGSGEMVFNAGLYDRLPYDPAKDYVPITMLAFYEMVLAANPAFPGNTMKEVVAMAKAKPGSLFYAYGSSVFQVATELFKKEQGINIVAVPYKGTNAANAAAIGGEVPIVATSIGPSMTLIQAGKLRALAVTGSKRSASLPDVPTTDEQGVHFDGHMWTGLFAPAGTPKPIIDKLNSELAIALKDPDLIKRFVAMGIETRGLGMPSAEFNAFVHADLDKTVKAIRAAGIKAD